MTLTIAPGITLWRGYFDSAAQRMGQEDKSGNKECEYGTDTAANHARNERLFRRNLILRRRSVLQHLLLIR